MRIFSCKILKNDNSRLVYKYLSNTRVGFQKHIISGTKRSFQLARFCLQKKLTQIQYMSSLFEIRLFITSIEYSAVPSKDCKRPIICLYSITYIFYPTNFHVHKNTNMCTLSELTYVEKPTYVHIFYQYTKLVKMSEHAWLILKEPSTESGGTDTKNVIVHQADKIHLDC